MLWQFRIAIGCGNNHQVFQSHNFRVLVRMHVRFAYDSTALSTINSNYSRATL